MNIVLYIGSALVLPRLVGGLIETKTDPFWIKQAGVMRPDLRHFTHVGAVWGFHIGYAFLIVVALVKYHLLPVSVPLFVEFLVAAGLVGLSYATARWIPFNQLRAYNTVEFSEADRAVLLVGMLLGPSIGGLFLVAHSYLLAPIAGLVLVLSAAALSASLLIWQHKREGAVLSPAVWAGIFGTLLILYQATTANSLLMLTISAGVVITVVQLLALNRITFTVLGGVGLIVGLLVLTWVLELNIWIGRGVFFAACAIWWGWGRHYIWFPLSFWCVVLAATVILLIQRHSELTDLQAIALYSLAVLAIMWLEIRRQLRTKSSLVETPQTRA